VKPIPIWLGGASDVVYRRATRLADGFVFGLGHDAAAAMPVLRAHLEEQGRDPATFGFDATVHVDDAGDWLDEAERLREAGVTMLTFSNVRRGFSPTTHIEVLADQLAALRGRDI
jgi:alkanesulfonate monooxygenase SsuD/methylene tetrahydromethanopterin reductase-like flavin-dependent oxidoreductase (luciferase family)